MELIRNNKNVPKSIGHSQKWICFEKSVIFFIVSCEVHVFWRNLQILFEIILVLTKVWRFRYMFVAFSEYMNFKNATILSNDTEKKPLHKKDNRHTQDPSSVWGNKVFLIVRFDSSPEIGIETK